jgi:hypothetical protein
MMATSLVDRVGFGIVVDATAVVAGSAVLGTTPLLVTMPDITAGGGGNGYIKVKIVNPNPTAVLAWKLVDRGAAAPVFGATFAANEGSHVLAGQVEYITIPTGDDLYIVASAAASSWSTTAQLIR